MGVSVRGETAGGPWCGGAQTHGAGCAHTIACGDLDVFGVSHLLLTSIILRRDNTQHIGAIPEISAERDKIFLKKSKDKHK